MSSRTKLKLDWCSYDAAKYACEKWHYSETVPAGKNLFLGIWENKTFSGVIIYGRGANRNMAGEFGLTCTECVELTRIAMTSSHRSPVSRVGAISLKLLKKHSPGLRLVVSYADPQQGHVGGIYQAMNWSYIGTSRPQSAIVGMHKRSASSKHGSLKGLPKTEVTFKHKYLMPLDDEMRKRIEPLRKPYPKRVTSADSGTPGIQPGGGGASPTVTLSKTEGKKRGKTRTKA